LYFPCRSSSREAVTPNSSKSVATCTRIRLRGTLPSGTSWFSLEAVRERRHSARLRVLIESKLKQLAKETQDSTTLHAGQSKSANDLTEVRHQTDLAEQYLHAPSRTSSMEESRKNLTCSSCKTPGAQLHRLSTEARNKSGLRLPPSAASSRGSNCGTVAQLATLRRSYLRPRAAK